MKSFKYRIYPTRSQLQILEDTLNTCRHTYNQALEQRISHYQTTKKSLTKFEQINWFTKNKNQFQSNIFSQVLQETIGRLDKSFQSFFKRLKEEKKPGFPRFKSKFRYRSFCYPQAGFKLKSQHIYLSKIGNVRIELSRPIEGIIKQCRVLKDVDQWYVILVCQTTNYQGPRSDLPPVGIDLGLEYFIYLSDGSTVQSPQFLRKSERRLRRAQRALSRRNKGSKNRERQRIRVARIHRKIRRQRDDFCHKISNQLVRNYGTICFEDLKIANMVRNHCLAKSIHDASWNKLVQYAQYKAENAGVRVVLVDPKGTSQRCSGCGCIVPKELKDRIHSCPECKMELDRDLNSAREVLKLGMEKIENTLGHREINASGDWTSFQFAGGTGKVRSLNEESAIL